MMRICVVVLLYFFCILLIVAPKYWILKYIEFCRSPNQKTKLEASTRIRVIDVFDDAAFKAERYVMCYRCVSFACFLFFVCN